MGLRVGHDVAVPPTGPLPGAYRKSALPVLETRLAAGELALYRALRRVNPSPYLFLLELDGLALVGSSPERLVACEDGRASVCPIAGTTTPDEGDVERLTAQERRALETGRPEVRNYYERLDRESEVLRTFSRMSIAASVCTMNAPPPGAVSKPSTPTKRWRSSNAIVQTFW
jgi:hypothetical protein